MNAVRPRPRASLFRGLPLFQGLSAEEADAIEARADAVSLRKKQVVWQPGQPADRVWFVRHGIVKTSWPVGGKRELTLQFHVKGDVFGEAAAVCPDPHETLAEAYEEVELVSVWSDDFLRVMRAHPDVAVRLGRLIFERRRRVEHRLAALLFKSAHARLAALFLELSEDFGVRDSRGVILNLKLTHKEMASLIGATRETVSFAILDLRKDGLIQTESKRVVLLDVDGLLAVAKE